MGFTPQQARMMSMWQYMAAVEGFNIANDPKADKALSEGEAEDLWKWLNDGD